MDWKNLLETAKSLGENELPEKLTDEMLEDDNFL